MTVSINNLGTASATSGNTVLTTTTSVPAGSVIVVGVTEHTSTIGGSVTDSAGNSYIRIDQQESGGSSSNGVSGSLWYAFNVTALGSGGTITYTKNSSSNSAGLTACYVTGVDTTNPLDPAVTAVAVGSSSSPTVTSGTPTVSGEAFIGCVFLNSTTTFTEDSTHGWSVPLNYTSDGGSAASIAGGSQINSGTGTIIFNPSFAASHAYAIWVIGFKPSGVTQPAWNVTGQGANSNSNATTVALSNLNIPANRLIVVGAAEEINSGGSGNQFGSISDSAGNTYTQIAACLQGNNSNTAMSVWYTVTSTTVTSITYTAAYGSASNKTITAISATGFNASTLVDSFVTASIGTTNSSSPSITSGAPVVSGELFVGFCAASNGPDTFTEASGWTRSAIYEQGNTNQNCDLAYQVNSGTGTLTYNPNLSSSENWGDIIVGFYPTGKSGPSLSWIGQSIGSSSGTSQSLTTGVAIPAGAPVVVLATQSGSTVNTGPTISDSKSNTWTLITGGAANGSGGNGAISCYYSVLTNALTSTDTITATRSGANSEDIGLTAWTLTNVGSPLVDSPTIATNTGSGNSVTVTSGTPTAAGDIFFAFLGVDNGSSWTGVSGWGNNFVPSSNNAGGWFAQWTRNPNKTAMTWNPTYGASAQWILGIVGFSGFVPFFALPLNRWRHAYLRR